MEKVNVDNTISETPITNALTKLLHIIEICQSNIKGKDKYMPRWIENDFYYAKGVRDGGLKHCRV